MINALEHNVRVLECLPVDTGYVDYDINHITAQFIWLHIDRWRIGGDEYFGDNIKEKRLLNAGILRAKKETGHLELASRFNWLYLPR